MDLNTVALNGRLTRDAEVRVTANGSTVAKMGLAVSSRRKNDHGEWEKVAHFFDCAYWGAGAEKLARYLVKGKQIGVTGELRQHRWEQDGARRSKVEIFVRNLQLLGGRDTANADAGPPRVRASKPDEPPFTDDIPF